MPCTYPHHDWLMYILYSCDTEFLGQVTRGAMEGVASTHNTQGINEALEPFAPTDADCMHIARIKLMVLLDQVCCSLISPRSSLPLVSISSQDEATRRRLCEYTSPLARDWRPVCPQKATRFYAELHNVLLPEWIKDETISHSEFIDRARMAYLVS